MSHSQFVPRPRFVLLAFIVSIFVFTLGTPCFSQAELAAQPPAPQLPADFEKYPGLLPAVTHLIEKLQHDMQFPGPRYQSQLLPLLPASTSFYLAIPNYGEVAHKSLAAFQLSMQEDTALRDWWQRGGLAANGPKIIDALNKFSQVSEYLGDEIVVSGQIGSKEPAILVVAQLRKPGLREALQFIAQQIAGPKKAALRILTPQQLSVLTVHQAGDSFLVLVGPDLVVASTDLATLRDFNSKLQRTPDFAATSFGQRVEKAYDGGISTVGAIDLHKVITTIPVTEPSVPRMLHLTGFDDVKYAVWNRATIGGHSLSQVELSFNGPRRGVASWLGAPVRTFGGLDFVSADSALAFSIALKDPGLIFGDIQDVVAASNPNGLASFAQTERSLGISLKDDLFAQLTGEVTVELDKASEKTAGWRVILQLRDPVRLQHTLATLFAATHLKNDRVEEEGLAYQVVQPPSAKAGPPIHLAYVENYLIVASSPEGLKEAVRLHSTSGSLGKSAKFQSALPPGRSGMSAVWYQDPMAMFAMQMKRLDPRMAAMFASARTDGPPIAMCLYGDETAIREASTNPGIDVGATMVVAAIAVPNLLRSRIAANEASAVGSVRTINTAQIVYATTYPNHGFARDLASLGSSTPNSTQNTAAHAGLLDFNLANPNCSMGKWCEKSGYRFTVTTSCFAQRPCTNFVVTATPVSTSTGGRNFCSTESGVIRMKSGPLLTAPVTGSDCLAWDVLR